MARARSSGPAVYVSALVFLGFGFVIFLALFIWAFARVEAAEKRADDAVAKLLEIANGQDQLRIRTFARDNQTGGAGLLEEVGKLKEWIAGDPQRELSAIGAERENLNVQGNLFAVIRALRENIAATELQIAQMDTNYKELLADKKRVQEDAFKLGENYLEKFAALETTVAALEQASANFEQKVRQDTEALEERFRAVREEAQRAQVDLRGEIAQLQQSNATLDARVKDLLAQLTTRQAAGLDPSRLKDGEVELVVARQNLVHIDLGRAHHILPGMTFEVFDRATGPVQNEDGEYEGKATIEVINVFEHASVTRIVRRASRGGEVLQGDVIANLVYDPNMTFRFYVFGAFDLDGRGEATPTDRQRVEMMIQDWGGALASSREPGGIPKPINYDVDFLVLGQAPALPQEPDPDSLDPEDEKRYVREKIIWETYQQLVSEARELSIPILNQNRFLTMVGYYQR